MRILLLGAYGFIGLAVARRLQQAGHEIVGFGRDLDLGRRLAPDLAWTGTDLATLSDEAAWQPYLDGIDAVVNAAGALQDSARDQLAASQQHAISALIKACQARESGPSSRFQHRVPTPLRKPHSCAPRARPTTPCGAARSTGPS